MQLNAKGTITVQRQIRVFEVQASMLPGQLQEPLHKNLIKTRNAALTTHKAQSAFKIQTDDVVHHAIYGGNQ